MEKEKIPQELIIPASEHPKAFEPAVLILNIVMCCLGAIIGLELIVRVPVLRLTPPLWVRCLPSSYPAYPLRSFRSTAAYTART